MSDKASQYAGAAAGWSDRQYADPGAYLGHRGDLVVGLGPRLQRGDVVLDLACGDGGLGQVLLGQGLHYLGVDAAPEMVAAARLRLGDRARIEAGEIDTYVPAHPVAATTVFRAIYYASDRPAFFRKAASYTERKLVFDLNPRQYRVADVVAELRAASFDQVALRPFLVPQTQSLPRFAVAALQALERAGPLGRLPLRVRFTYLVAAWRSSDSTAA